MSDTLKNQLLGLGFKPASAPERKPESGKPPAARPPSDKPHRAGPSSPTATGQRDRNPRREGAVRGRDAGTTRTDTPANTRSAASRPARSREEIDLAKAYALRGEYEKRERIAAEQKKQEEARLRREAKARLTELLKGQALNDAGAEHVRHFEYGGKIKRIHVTAGQLKALNAGELGVLQDGGRYLLVTASLLAEAEAIFAPAVALKIDPDSPAADDPYSDSAYQIPDDLVW